MRITQTIGTKSLWEREKTLFLTSRKAPLSCYEKIFQWVEKFDKQGCAVCFKTSELEEEVLKALLVCHVPTTLVLPKSGKGMEHMASFDYGYKIAAVRDWLFEQSR